jgi:hypothetical protein
MQAPPVPVLSCWGLRKTLLDEVRPLFTEGLLKNVNLHLVDAGSNYSGGNLDHDEGRKISNLLANGFANISGQKLKGQKLGYLRLRAGALQCVPFHKDTPNKAPGPGKVRVLARVGFEDSFLAVQLQIQNLDVIFHFPAGLSAVLIPYTWLVENCHAVFGNGANASVVCVFEIDSQRSLEEMMEAQVGFERLYLEQGELVHIPESCYTLASRTVSNKPREQLHVYANGIDAPDCLEALRLRALDPSNPVDVEAVATQPIVGILLPLLDKQIQNHVEVEAVIAHPTVDVQPLSEQIQNPIEAEAVIEPAIVNLLSSTDLLLQTNTSACDSIQLEETTRSAMPMPDPSGLVKNSVDEDSTEQVAQLEEKDATPVHAKRIDSQTPEQVGGSD